MTELQTNGTEPLIVVENLVKTYKMGGETLHALDHVSLVIRRGEFVCIIGPSGSGKSTLMNMLGCLDTPTSGSYRLAASSSAFSRPTRRPS